MAQEPALHAPLPLATRRAAMKLLHASRSNTAAATARRPPKRTCSPSPLSDHLVAVDLRCGKANSNTLLPGHEVAVGLRCGKANTKAPRSFVRLDLVFPRDSSERSVPCIKEESSRLATSSPFSKSLTERSLCGWDVCCHPPEPRSRRSLQGLQALSVFTHANPRASGSVATSGTGRRIYSARRASGDATAPSPISWTLFP